VSNNVTAAPSAGVELKGIDTSRPVARDILRELDQHGLLVLRGQRLTPQTFMAFAASLGELATHPLNTNAPPELPQLMLHTNIMENGKPLGYAGAERQWRIDGAHLAKPWRASLAYAAEAPMRDGQPLGDTWFADMRAAYDALPPALQRQLTGLRAAHPYGSGRKRRDTPYFADSGMTQIFKRGVDHPIVRMHPRTRRKTLYVSPGSTSHVCGLHERDSDALLQALHAHLDQPAFHYRHQWRAGDLLLWDCAVMQYRTGDDFALPLRWLIYRTQLKGS
jgi:taurine dioxygenase